jgi:hypothetical protein
MILFKKINKMRFPEYNNTNKEKFLQISHFFGGKFEGIYCIKESLFLPAETDLCVSDKGSRLLLIYIRTAGSLLL